MKQLLLILYKFVTIIFDIVHHMRYILFSRRSGICLFSPDSVIGGAVSLTGIYHVTLVISHKGLDITRN